jgi:uncharacterized protein
MTDSTVDTKRAWIQTYGGGQFHILDPQQDEIRITDIGHALAMLCRFTGHTRKFYSIAEHSVLGSYLVPPKDALYFLMHDSSESYLNDINRPLKHFTGVGSEYLPVEKIVMEAILHKFRLPLEEPASIKKIDNAMLFAEKEQLLVPMEWDAKWGDVKSADVRVRCWAPEIAEVEFLHRFYELTQQI